MKMYAFLVTLICVNNNCMNLQSWEKRGNVSHIFLQFIEELHFFSKLKSFAAALLASIDLSRNPVANQRRIISASRGSWYFCVP